MVREWMLGHGRLRIGITSGIFFGAGMGAFFYFQNSPRLVAEAIAGGIVSGVLFGTVMARILPRVLCTQHLSGLSQPDRLAVRAAVMHGQPVSDPQLAPSALAHARAVMESTRKQQARPRRWLFFAIAVLELVLAAGKTITGPTWMAVFFWIATAFLLTLGLAAPWALGRQHTKAQAAAESAADQMSRLESRPWQCCPRPQQPPSSRP
jgi:predicted lysophospholipase L1 biosynthesis ABC-type transport system permease subunit